MLCHHEGNLVFCRKRIKFVTARDLIKCLKHIRYQKLLLICTPASEIPFNMISSTMIHLININIEFVVPFFSKKLMAKRTFFLHKNYYPK